MNSQIKKTSSRERLIQKKKQRRKIAIMRLTVIVVFIGIFCGAVKLVSVGVRAFLNKDAVFITKLQDTVTPKITSSLSPNEENDLLNIAKITAPDPKVCYITFDDGPNNNVTLQIADILRRYNAKATFFEVGSLIEAYPDVTRRLHNENHLIANHSFAHNYNELYASTDTFMSEINHTQEIIQNTLGVAPFKLIRFPGGSYNSGKFAEIKQECKEILKSNEYFFADWNCLTGDAEGSKKTPDDLLEGLKKTLNNQSQAIILMHDASSKKTTVEALPLIMDYLVSQGYVFDTLDHMRTD